jgi:hypothetical protein
MRTFLVVPIVLFTIYLIANYFLNPQYNSASFRDFLVASIQPITWACGLVCCMSSEHFGQLAWQFKRMSGSSGLKVQAAIAC